MHNTLPDQRILSPSCERNKAFILDVLRGLISPNTQVLEVGSLTGQHAAFLSKNLDVDWQPTDVKPHAESIAAWAKFEDATRVAKPFALDLFSDFPTFQADALVCINTIHIAPWPATKRLFELGKHVLRPGGCLILYGPFEYRDRELEPSNVEFNTWLGDRYPGGGIRMFEDICAIADELGYTLGQDTPMPANNHVIHWQT